MEGQIELNVACQDDNVHVKRNVKYEYEVDYWEEYVNLTVYTPMDLPDDVDNFDEDCRWQIGAQLGKKVHHVKYVQ